VVLIADTDRELLDLAEDLLSMDDYRVLRTASVADLIATLERWRPDLVVLDLQMVEQTGPGTLLEAIHERFPDVHVPIIGLSRPGMPPERLSRLVVDRYITKPFSVSVLRSIVRELIVKHAPIALPHRSAV
jgi:DNA-binding response OmpR family regulator